MPNSRFPNQPAPSPAYTAAVRTAVIAGVFCAVVAGMLLVDYARREAVDPHETEAYQAAKTQLADLASQPQTPETEARVDELRVAVRAMDLQFRREYFAHRRFTRVGALMLLVGAAVLLVAWRASAALRPPLPDPGPHAPPQDAETQWTRWARAGIGAVSVALLLVAVGLLVSVQRELPGSETKLAALMDTRQDGGPDEDSGDEAGDGPTEASSGDPATADFPSPEELARNWPSFRGPGGAGVSAHDNLPARWDDATGENILWKTPVPLPGNNSPVVWGNKVFMTGADETTRQVYCFDAERGELLWTADVPNTPRTPAEPPEVMSYTGYAASTAAVDGRRVYAMFANGDITAVDLNGKIVWQQSLGMPENHYGHASSLATHRDLLLIQFDQGSRKDGKSRMIALKTATGETAWKVPRDVSCSWASPIVAEAAGRMQLVTAASPWAIAYDPADGSELWRAECLKGGEIGPSPVVRDDVAYTVNEYPCLSAIKAAGSGDVTESHVLWTGEDGLPDTASPLAADKHLFLIASYGIFTCYDRAEGEWLWEMEFEGQFSSSPTLVGDRVYLFGEMEKPEEEMTEAEKDAEEPVMISRGWVIEPGLDEGTIVGRGRFEEGCVTSPAPQDGRFFIRGRKHLYAIGQSNAADLGERLGKKHLFAIGQP